MFCAPEPVSGGIEGAEPNFHVPRPPDLIWAVPGGLSPVLRSRTRF
jgi:hypothetical protein